MGNLPSPPCFTSLHLPTSLSSIVQTILLCFLGLLLLLKLVHRLSLNLPPGPSGWPLIGSLAQFPHGLNPHILSKLTETYGPIFMVKLGEQNLVVVSSPELAMDVLQRHGVEFGARYRNLLIDVLTNKGQDLVFADYGEHYKNVRRVCTRPFFSGKAIQQCRQGWEAEITIAMENIKNLSDASTTSGAIMIKDQLQLMMYSIVYRMMFDRGFTGLDDPLYLEIMRLNANSRRLIMKFRNRCGDFFPSLKPFFSGFLEEVRTANQQDLTFFKKAYVEELKEQGGQTKAGVHHILDSHAKGELTENTVLYLIQNINVAAIDSTVWAMEWGVAELVNNRQVQEKLRNELDSVVGKGVFITEPDLARLPYLQAVVKELLRRHMVIPLLVPHRNLQPAKIGKYDIPVGSKVYVNALGMANDPKYWDKPEVFDPTRFLDSKMEMSGNDMRFIPFGAGRRSCPGMAMAVVVLSLVLGRMVQEFELRPPPGESEVDMKAVGGLIHVHIRAGKSKVVVQPRSN